MYLYNVMIFFFNFENWGWGRNVGRQQKFCTQAPDTVGAPLFLKFQEVYSIAYIHCCIISEHFYKQCTLKPALHGSGVIEEGREGTTSPHFFILSWVSPYFKFSRGTLETRKNADYPNYLFFLNDHINKLTALRKKCWFLILFNKVE